MVVLTKAFVKFSKPVKGIRVINRKFLLQTLQSERGDSTSISIIWANQEQLVDRLIGYAPCSNICNLNIEAGAPPSLSSGLFLRSGAE